MGKKRARRCANACKPNSTPNERATTSNGSGRSADILVRPGFRGARGSRFTRRQTGHAAADKNVRAPATAILPFMKTTRSKQQATFIDEAKIAATLTAARSCDPQRVREILAKAREMHGLNASDMATPTGAQSAHSFSTCCQVLSTFATAGVDHRTSLSVTFRKMMWRGAARCYNLT